MFTIKLGFRVLHDPNSTTLIRCSDFSDVCDWVFVFFHKCYTDCAYQVSAMELIQTEISIQCLCMNM